MYIFLNLLLVPPVLLCLILAFFHLFGGPLPHHYLYTARVDAGSTAAATTAVNEPSAADSASMFAPKNHRSPGINSLLHRLRICLLGDDESARHMVVFRAAQRKVWRLYKYLLRLALKTGELERMITESEIQMVPLGNCIQERVGFHPHLVSLSVRISSYLRTSKQLQSVLALEDSSSAAEVVAASAIRASPALAQAVADAPQEGDEDETPMDTPNLTAAAAAAGLGDPPALALGLSATATSSSSGGGVQSSPLSLKHFQGLNMATAHHRAPLAVAAFLQQQAPSTAAAVHAANASTNNNVIGSPATRSRVPAALTLPTSSSFTSSSSSSSSAFVGLLPQPPHLALSASDEVCSLELQDRRANHLLQLIVAIKHISRTSGNSYSNLFRPVLYRALVSRNEVEDFLRFQLEPVLAIRYDKDNPAHERWLAELWELTLPLGPGRPTPSSRVSKDWGALGFQGSDPATDFRAMGVLGLRNLIEFARLCPILSNLILRHCQESDPLKWFGFALAGIHLTADLVHLCRTHALDAYFYTYGANWHSFHALYATMFVKWDDEWSEARPETIMAYSQVHAAFVQAFRSEAECFPFSPRSLASAQFQISQITPVTPRIILRNETEQELQDSAEEFDLGEDVTEVTEGLVSRRASKSSSHWGITGRSRSASPFSVSGVSNSAVSHPSSPNSRTSSPGLHALSRSEFLEAGGVLPLGNMLDPVCPPSMFARHPLPDWNASS